MLYGLLIAIHVIACLVLIAVILLQAGRGGGLSESFGGNLTQSLFGTKTNIVLNRATAVCAILFIITCLSLGVLTSRRGKSLVQLQGSQGAPPPVPSIPITQPLEPMVEQPLGEEKTVLDETKENLPKAEPESLPTE